MHEKRYTTLWRNKHLKEADSMTELASVLRDAADEVEAMLADGVELEVLGGDYYLLSTNDPAVAEKYGMTEEDEDEDEDQLGEEDLDDAQEDDGLNLYVHGGEG